jgi:serine/threonine protein kinase/uncharacterized protein YjdB
MTSTTTPTCPQCGGAVLSGDRFCGSCGNAVGAVISGQVSLASSPSAALMTAPPASAMGATSAWDAVAAHLQATTLGEFEIMTELGRGGMAAVYLARDLALNRRVAIKVMAPGLLHGPGMVERFRQEAVTVANLQHAHIVSIHAVRQLEDLHFFVMQFVPGRTLEGLLREYGALPIPVVRAWLFQMGSALGYAHRRGVIHRDIKPGNILLNADGEAIVTDFGIAKVAEGPSHTQTGSVVGTPVYMSPEQCYARELTGASDQYSLGVVAYEMLAGKPPFSGASFALMRAHTDETPPPIRAVRPDVPPAMEAAVLRMLAKKPEERFATLGEALVSLGAGPVAPDDPLHLELQRLAAARERLEQLGDVLRTPASPVPKTRERPKQASAVGTTPSTQGLSVVMAPPPSDLEPGATATLRALVKNATGQRVSDAEVRWTSSAPSFVAIDARTGLLKALAKGSAIIAAISDGAQDSVEVIIGSPRAANIAISMPPGALAAGDHIVVSAVITSRFGVRVARPIAWSVNEPSIAAIDEEVANASGPAATVRGISAGTASVIAMCDNAMARASVTVVAAPTAGLQSGPARAAGKTTPPPARGGSRLRWAIPALTAAGVVAYIATRPSPSTVDRVPPAVQPAPTPASTGASGLTSTPAVATPSVPTTSARSDSAAPRPNTPSSVVRLDVQLGKPAAIAPGETVAITVTARDAAGGAMPDARITWTSGDPRIATVDAALGVVRGIGAGATRITARVGGVTAGVMVSVVPRPVETAAAPTRERAARPPIPAPAASVAAPPPTAAKSEAALRAEIETVLSTYAHAIELRDTAQIRRVFPNAGSELLKRWQTTFDDARGAIRMTGGAVEILDTPRDARGAQVRVRAQYSARFSSRAARSDQSFPVAFTAAVQHDGGVWRITSIQ